MSRFVVIEMPADALSSRILCEADTLADLMNRIEAVEVKACVARHAEAKKALATESLVRTPCTTSDELWRALVDVTRNAPDAGDSPLVVG